MRSGFEHPHGVAVLVAEEGNGARRLGLVLAGLVMVARGVGENVGIGQVLDSGHLFSGQGLEVAEVEPEPIGSDMGALLLDVVSEHTTQGRMQEVRPGVVASDGRPPFDVDGCPDLLANGQPIIWLAGLRQLDVVPVETVEGQRGVEHLQGATLEDQRTGIADLASRLGVEGRAIQHHHIIVGVQHGCRGLIDLTPHERRGAVLFEHGPQVTGRRRPARVLPSRPGPGLLVGHGGPETLEVHPEATLGGDLLGQLQGEAVGVVELEGHVAVETATVGQPVQGLVEDHRSGPQGLAEPTLLSVQDVAHEGVVSGQLRVVESHDPYDGIH